MVHVPGRFVSKSWPTNGETDFGGKSAIIMMDRKNCLR
jgi:hypothetical protein